MVKYMFNRRELKEKGKKAFYRNYKAAIIITFIYAILVGNTVINFKNDFNFREETIKPVSISKLKGETNSHIVNEFIKGLNGNKHYEDNFMTHATRGVIANISNNISLSGSYLFGGLNAINQMLFKDRIWAGIIIIIGASISLLYWIFVSKVLEVGNARFYLENRIYIKTRASKLILPYKLGKTLNVAYTMFLKNVKILLWSFTIIGGFIKHYTYILVPYILAENPNIKAKDALCLSKDMMQGYKWEVFKLDMSFILYYILGIITFNISNMVFTTPYMNATNAEVYIFLRNNSKKNNIKNIELLKDYNLDKDITLEEYPVYEYMLKDFKKNKVFNINYNRDYSIWDLILMYFIFSIFGWVYEVVFIYFQQGLLVNRGTLYGPWLPIYGAGGVLILIILKKFRKNYFLYFILTMILCGVIEYGTSIYLEVVHGMIWWEYNDYFLNLNGRICLEGLLLFGIAGVIVTYIAAPILSNLLSKIKKNIKIIISIILVSLIAVDFYIAGSKPNTGDGVSGVVENSKFDVKNK